MIQKLIKVLNIQKVLSEEIYSSLFKYFSYLLEHKTWGTGYKRYHYSCILMNPSRAFLL